MAPKKKTTEKKVTKPRKKASIKVIIPVVADSLDDDFSTDSAKFAFRHSVPDVFIEPERPLPPEEELEEESIDEEIVETVEDEPSQSTHFVVATQSIQIAETSETPMNFLNFNISDAISKSIAEKFGINHKQIDIILTGNNDDIEISFARIYLSGEDVARLSIGE